MGKTIMIIKKPKIKSRVLWGDFNPSTRAMKSKKSYCRKNYKVEY